MNRKPERNELQILLDHCNLAVGTWAPGDGKTRYRFFQRTDAASSNADYHEGDGIYTALGRGEAVTYLRGYRAALNATRAQAMRAALQVFTLDQNSRAWLLANDPQALKQALAALGEDTTEVQRYCAGGDMCLPPTTKG